MSAQFVAQLSHLSHELARLSALVETLSERIEALEAEAKTQDVDIDSLTVKPRGRPRKVTQ